MVHSVVAKGNDYGLKKGREQFIQSSSYRGGETLYYIRIDKRRQKTTNWTFST